MLSTADLRVYCKLPRLRDPNDEAEATLVGLRASAVAHLERVWGVYLGPLQQVTRTVAGKGSDRLFLPEGGLAVASDLAPYPTAVQGRANRGDDPTEIAFDADDGFEVDPPASLWRLGGSWWARGYLYDVTYWQGYEVGGIPEGSTYDAEGAAALYQTDGSAYLIGAPEDARQAVRKLVAHWYESRLPVVVGAIVESLPDDLDALIRSRRRPRV